MWLKVVRDAPALEVEGTVGRPVRMDKIPLEDDRLVARPDNGERSRESRDAASCDDELHTSKLSRRRRRRQAGSASRTVARMPQAV